MKHEVGVGVNRTVHLPLGQGKQLRVVRGYKQLGAMTAATLRCDPEVAARATAASCAESAISRDICAQQSYLDRYALTLLVVSKRLAVCRVHVAVFVGPPEKQACCTLLQPAA